MPDKKTCLRTRISQQRQRGKSRAAFLILFAVLPCLQQASAQGQAAKTSAADSESQTTADSKQVDALLDAMRRRLKIMHDVARWKWNAGKAIEDPEREQQLLTQLERRGREFNLSPADTRRLMRAQMEAGKRIQRADWNKWRREGRKPFEDVPDLNRELRPQIDRASEELLSAFAALRERLADPALRKLIRDRADRALREAGLDESVRTAATQGWLGEAAPNSGLNDKR